MLEILLPTCWIRTIAYVVLAWLLFLVCQWILARPSLHTLKCHIKYGLFHIALIFIPAISILPSIFRPGNSANVKYVRWIVKFSQLSKWFGVKVEFEGLENFHLATKPCVCISNHQTTLDVLAVMEVFVCPSHL